MDKKQWKKKKKKNIRLRDASPTNITAIYICKHFLKIEKKIGEDDGIEKKKIDLTVTSHNSPFGSSF